MTRLADVVKVTSWMAEILSDRQGCAGKLDLASSGLFSVWTASGCIDVLFKYACFAVLARRKIAHSRANDGVSRQSLRVPRRST